MGISVWASGEICERFWIWFIYLIHYFPGDSQENFSNVEERYDGLSKNDEFSSGSVYNDDDNNVGDDDDDEVETIERNDAIFHKPLQDSDDDWERVADSDFSFERSVSFHSEHLDHNNEDAEIGDDTVRWFFFT